MTLSEGIRHDRLDILLYTQDVGGSNPSLPTNPQSDPPHPNILRSDAVEHTAIREIPLTRNRVALVDEEDFARFGHLKWTAGTFGSKLGYAHRGESRAGKLHTVLLHRAILNAQPGQIVDHRNRDTFDCRRANLRLATPSENARNSRRKASLSGFIGVDSQTSERYRGRVFADGHSHYTATYGCPVLAACARDVLAQRLHGEFSVLNFQYIPIVSQEAL